MKSILKQRKKDLIGDPEKIYNKFLELVEQVYQARIVADLLHEYRWKRVAKTSYGNSLISFSQVGVENFAILQVYKLFDDKSAFSIWDVSTLLNRRELADWIELNSKELENDIRLIEEWRSNTVGHRSEAVYYASDEYEKKFTQGRTSERKLLDFLFRYLAEIKFHIKGTPQTTTLEELNIGYDSFESHIKKLVNDTFKKV